jgi:hypothetical protein
MFDLYICILEPSGNDISSIPNARQQIEDITGLKYKYNITECNNLTHNFYNHITNQHDNISDPVVSAIDVVGRNLDEF